MILPQILGNIPCRRRRKYQQGIENQKTHPGDGESNEGQVWEAAMFAAAKKVTNLVWLIDWNKKQLDGYVNDVMDFYISLGEQIPWEYSGNVMMYTPVAIKNPKKRSIFSFMVNFFKEKFTKS